MRDRFQTLFASHGGLVGKIARAYARDSESRLDLEQEIAAQAWRAYPSYDDARARFSTWLFRVALNVAISHLRRARSFEPLGEVAVVPAFEDERIEAMYASIRELEPLKRALVLLYLEDRSYREIAETLGISEANVAVRLTRIKAELRTQLKGA